MLLRRVIEHVTEQNWFAVFIDFLIVVIGVFIGIQVANWNEERLNRQEEQVLVQRLRVDFQRIKEDADVSLAFHQRMNSNLQIVVRSLRAKQLRPEHVDAFENALVFGITFQTSADHSGTFTELMSSGRANILHDRRLLDDLVAYEDFLTRFEFAQQYYIGLVRESMRGYTSAFAYDASLELSQALFEGAIEVDEMVSYDFDALVNNPEFHDAAELLMFVHSGFVLWRQRISKQVNAIERTLSASGLTELPPVSAY